MTSSLFRALKCHTTSSFGRFLETFIMEHTMTDMAAMCIYHRLLPQSIGQLLCPSTVWVECWVEFQLDTGLTDGAGMWHQDIRQF